jgi:hypothetical protein
VSVGAGIAIAVAKLFSATVSDFELAVDDMAYSSAELFATRESQSPAPPRSAPQRRIRMSVGL